MAVSCFPPPLPEGAGAAPGPGGLGGRDGGGLGMGWWQRFGFGVAPVPLECSGPVRSPALGPVVYSPAPACPSHFVEFLWGLCLPWRDFCVISFIPKQPFLQSEKDLALIVREVF